MVQCFKQKKPATYSKQDPAVASLRYVSLGQVSRNYGLPVKTLHDHLRGLQSCVGAGKPLILSREKEREITASCIVMQELGFGLTEDIVSLVVSQYL